MARVLTGFIDENDCIGDSLGPTLGGTRSTINQNFYNLDNAVTGPAFQAYSASATTAINNQYTKITLNTKRFDTNNCFANSRFTPNVPGYYQINATLYGGPGTGNSGTAALLAIISKNATVYGTSPSWTEVYFGNHSLTGTYASNVSTLLYLNGTTDFVELLAWQASGSNHTIPSSSLTNMSGFLARPV